MVRLSVRLIGIMACFVMTALISTLSFAEANKQPIPVDQAFVFTTTLIPPNEVLLNWRIAPGTYLYRDKIHVSFSPDTKAEIPLPPAEKLQDEKRGQEEVYAGQLTVPIQLKTTLSSVNMQVAYQGCSHDGYCYPPVKKIIQLNLAKGTATNDNTNTVPLASLVMNQEGVQALLSASSLGTTLLIFLGLGLLLSLTPCVLPMVPILTGIIVGQKGYVSTRKAFLLSLVYVLGMAITYSSAGVIAALFGASIQVYLQKPIFILLGSILFVVLGIGLLGLYELRISHHWQNWVTSWSNRNQSGTFVGVFSMGVLSTLILSPCVTAPLVGVLMYIGNTGNVILGASALFVMAIGMGIPLLLVGMSAGNWLPKTGPWMEVIKKVFGFLMLGMAIWVASRVLPPHMIVYLVSLLLLAVAIFFLSYMPKLIGYRWANRSIAAVSILAAMFVFFSNIGVVATPYSGATFTTVKNGETLGVALIAAKEKRLPVILDFYADWCETCVEMDHQVLSNPVIQKMLSKFVLIRVDISENSKEDEMLLKKYAVVAPPTMLFFNMDGQEVGSRRIIGGLDTKELASRLDLFMAEGCDKKQYC